jgi:ectoine hydroxylase-related dioxygenase (phytanoyl-CoA dioxygenase family)
MTQAAHQSSQERVLPYPTSPSELERHRRTMDQDGYLVFRDVVPKAQLEQLRKRLHEEFENVKASGALFAGGGIVSGHLNCFPGAESRFIWDAVSSAGIVDLVRTMFPMATRSPNVGCNMNLPGSVAQHYHADGLFVEQFPIINIAVVDTNLENGAIDILPATHKRFYRFWEYAAERLYKRTTRITMKQGDVLVRPSTLWHRGMPNKTAVPRPMVALTWEHGGKEEDGFAIHDGQIRFLPNWFKTDFFGQIREHTFVKIPLSYSAYRFAKSLRGNKGYAEW